jgi:hypothetical protein
LTVTDEGRRSESVLSVAQGLWLLVPGLWLACFPSHYRKVHELEADYWIERVHAVWLTLVGGVLLIAGLRRRPSLETRVLGMGAATGVAAADIAAARKGGLARIYFIDLLGEFVFAVLGPLSWRRGCDRSRHRLPPDPG